jgi:hypothetical protein
MLVDRTDKMYRISVWLLSRVFMNLVGTAKDCVREVVDLHGILQ